ncbi:MAG: zf-HC2 domain-containing protein [Chloroflexia bacterium]|nr:zf-HC2 domain-containing protein [Chloroflexia bacterium]
MTRHPMTDDELISYALGDLSPARRQEVASHLAECPDCHDAIGRLSQTVALLRAPRMAIIEAPLETRDRARLLLGRVRPDLVREVTPAWTDRVREVLASLTFDSRQTFALGGLRSTDTSTRQLSYESPLADLDLQIAPLPAQASGERRWRVMGQLTLVEPAMDLHAEFSSSTGDATGPPVAVVLDRDGYFTTDLVVGGYTLRVPIGESVLVFPDLDLR